MNAELFHAFASFGFAFVDTQIELMNNARHYSQPQDLGPDARAAYAHAHDQALETLVNLENSLGVPCVKAAFASYWRPRLKAGPVRMTTDKPGK